MSVEETGKQRGRPPMSPRAKKSDQVTIRLRAGESEIVKRIRDQFQYETRTEAIYKAIELANKHLYSVAEKKAEAAKRATPSPVENPDSAITTQLEIIETAVAWIKELRKSAPSGTKAE
ncbi:MAG: hypothetical protein GC168_10015 [Candidatus Hydrogenedens sp.]|nr:hypothetical protein [Candidatus Hydrogenedens sp.]